MKRPFLGIVISFLLGVLWALMAISVLLTFFSLFHSSFVAAIALSLLVGAFWLFLIVILEMANIQIEKLKELRRQSEILESIEKRLYE